MFKNVILSVGFLMVGWKVSLSQCAMCKAANESSLSGADNGFNAAIIFLMSVPYVIGAAAVVAFLVFWNKRKKIEQN